MNLKKFTPETLPSRTGGPNAPTIAVSRKSGLITINKLAVDLIKLKAGDEIILVQDEHDTENWYVQKIATGGWELRQLDSGALAISSVPAARTLLGSLEIDTDKQVRMLIAGTPTKEGKETYWGILSNSAKWGGKI